MHYTQQSALTYFHANLLMISIWVSFFICSVESDEHPDFDRTSVHPSTCSRSSARSDLCRIAADSIAFRRSARFPLFMRLGNFVQYCINMQMQNMHLAVREVNHSLMVCTYAVIILSLTVFILHRSHLSGEAWFFRTQKRMSI